MPFHQYVDQDPLNTYGPVHDAIKKYINSYSVALASELLVSNPQRSLEQIESDNLGNEDIRSVSDALQSGNYKFTAPKMIVHNLDNTFCIVFVIRVHYYNIAVAIPSAQLPSQKTPSDCWVVQGPVASEWYLASNAINTSAMTDCSQVMFTDSVHVNPICVGQFEYPDVSNLIVDALAMSKRIREDMIETYGEITSQY
tara:strand:- start:1480 stop:2073 length:594 start_codon:yes stop_codon:yes gene_type:complete